MSIANVSQLTQTWPRARGVSTPKHGRGLSNNTLPGAPNDGIIWRPFAPKFTIWGGLVVLACAFGDMCPRIVVMPALPVQSPDTNDQATNDQRRAPATPPNLAQPASPRAYTNGKHTDAQNGKLDGNKPDTSRQNKPNKPANAAPVSNESMNTKPVSTEPVDTEPVNDELVNDEPVQPPHPAD